VLGEIRDGVYIWFLIWEGLHECISLASDRASWCRIFGMVHFAIEVSVLPFAGLESRHGWVKP
jgi:hypothetical protein